MSVRLKILGSSPPAAPASRGPRITRLDSSPDQGRLGHGQAFPEPALRARLRRRLRRPRQTIRAARPRRAALLREAFRADRFDGTLRFLDVRTKGTLEELSQTHADLALIALAPQRRGGRPGDRRAHRLQARRWSSRTASRRAGRPVAQDRAPRGRAPAGPQFAGLPAPAAAPERQRGRAAGQGRAARAGVAVGRAHRLDARLGAAERRGLFQRGVARPAHLGGHSAGARLSWPTTRPRTASSCTSKALPTRAAS
jgi:hypothetical protein